MWLIETKEPATPPKLALWWFRLGAGSRRPRDNGIAFAQHPERSFFSNEIELAMRADQNLRVLLP
ncbi:hypothetical protein SynRS9902_01339 [Synechococcus sp. RS9902]|nr:hypothetical protein SynRS9902_01339 [Synechococcus sp. RS9902]